MKTVKTFTTLSLLLAGLVVMSLPREGAAVETDLQKTRARAEKLQRDGNYKDALDVFHKLALDPRDEPDRAGGDLQQALACLNQLDRSDETDAFRESVIKVHSENWRLLFAAAQTLFQEQHFGFIVGGEFSRGAHRGGGRQVDASERDRVRALQLMDAARGKIAGEKDTNALFDFHLQFSAMLLGERGYNDAWRLQYLTDLQKLPDYDEASRGWGRFHGGETSGAPVNEDGSPVFHHLPKNWDDAKTDGERWRWLLAQAMDAAPSRANEVLHSFAEFLQQQFGEQTLAYYGRWFGREGETKEQSGTFALHTLGEDETIARLATGVKRFKLPDEFNYIQIHQRIADNRGAHAEDSLNTLAQIFENRRQYDRALEFWTRSIREFGAGNEKWKQKRVDQITGHWGRFEPVMSQPAGRGATVDFVFRNGEGVSFEAHEILVPKLLADVKDFLKSNPRHPEDENHAIGNIGWRLVEKNQTRYIGGRAAAWELKLQPREKHFDKRLTVQTPLQKPGAYLVTAKMAGGNTCKIILWIADTVIVKKPLDKKSFCFVADAVTGQPVAKANVEFFGYRIENRDRKFFGRDFDTITTGFAEFTDANGQVTFTPKDQKDRERFNWLVTATTDAGRFAYLGFSNVWYDRAADYDRIAKNEKTFVITDRPVYRPKQPVKFKLWVRYARYDQADTSDYAHKKFKVQIHNPQGEKVYEKLIESDDYAGVDGEFALPANAALGQYQIQAGGYNGQGSFRVEEYKKPEFEVKVEAPTEPVMLGEKIAATVTAKYYFGAPVVKAKVKYTVTRTDHDARWFPIAPWDWFYGSGYWWFAGDYAWYPGWRSWGCMRPHPFWWPVNRTPPEIVAEGEAAIGADGKYKINIDTALAKELHGDTDHRYEITAEVVDESRRTIVGTGSVLVARQPFKVYAWVDRGHYRTGDTVRAEFAAQTLDSKPVKGKGELTLFKISYAPAPVAGVSDPGHNDRKPIETVVQKWPLDTDDEGRSRMQIDASKAGQFRLSFKVTDDKQHTIEGGYVFVVRGEGFTGKEFRFNQIELVTDKREYAPGEKVRLMINTDRANSTVVLFIRPSNGVYLPPKILSLAGKSAVEEIEVAKGDMPNFFIEALTISDGKIHTETREVIVPPEKRVLNVDVQPSKETYKPGEKAKMQIKLTDFAGNPFMGSTAVSVYDKSVEYISGGSNVPEIKAFFWKWRRAHNPHTESNLDRTEQNLTPPKRDAMQALGVFGEEVADEQAGFELADASGRPYRGMVSKLSASPVMARSVTAMGGMALSATMPASAPMEGAKFASADKTGEEPDAPSATVEPTIRK